MAVPLSLQAGRIKLVGSHPYLGDALWRLALIECKEVSKLGGPIGVDDRWRLYYDPDETDWPAEQMATVLYHEVLHLLRRHGSRCQVMSAHPRLWNVAADLEINDDLEEEELPFPIQHLMPSQFGFPDKLLAEEYYNRLLDNAVEVKCVGVTNGTCGSCATGSKEEHEMEGDDSDGDGSEGVSGIEADILRQSIAEAIRDYEKSGRGDVPGHLTRWASQWLSPAKVPWQKELASHVRKAISTVAGRVDYTYARPSRRQGAYGDVIMPALREPCPNVGVVVDTSGSMGDKDLQDAVGEIKGILMSVGQRNGVDVMAVDAAVHTAQKVFDVRQVKLIGGGGTDMGEGLAAMEKKRPRPSVVVVLTDGYTPWPVERPPFSVIVALIGGYREEVPKWAKMVVVE